MNSRAGFELDTSKTLEDESVYSSILFWGEEGTGKTTALADMANLPGDGKIVIVNKEGGLRKAALRRMGIDPEQIVPWPPKDSGIEITYDNLEQLHLEIARRLKAEPGCIKGVGWDSVTEISQDLLLQAAERHIRRAEEKGRERDEFDTEQADWGTMSSQVKTLLRRFRDLPCHFGVTALQREPDGKKEIAVGPAVNPGLSNGLLGYVTFAVQLEANVYRTADGPVTLVRANTKKTPRRRCKDRDGILPEPMPEPLFSRIHAYATGELTADNDPGFAAHAAVKEQAAAFRSARNEEKESD